MDSNEWVTLYESPLPGRIALIRMRLDSERIPYQIENEQTGSYAWALTFPLPWARGQLIKVPASQATQAKKIIEGLSFNPVLDDAIVMWFCRSILLVVALAVIFSVFRALWNH